MQRPLVGLVSQADLLSPLPQYPDSLAHARVRSALQQCAAGIIWNLRIVQSTVSLHPSAHGLARDTSLCSSDPAFWAPSALVQMP